MDFEFIFSVVSGPSMCSYRSSVILKMGILGYTVVVPVHVDSHHGNLSKQFVSILEVEILIIFFLAGF